MLRRERCEYHAPESNQVLTTDCGGNGELLRLDNLFTKATDFSYVKTLIISKITFIFDTKIKMLTPLVQFPTITFKTATDLGSEAAVVPGGVRAVDPCPALVLFLNGAIKQGDRSGWSGVAPLESIREPSSDCGGEEMRRRLRQPQS